MSERFIPWCGRGNCSKCYDGVICEHETILDKNGKVIGTMKEEMERQDRSLTRSALAYAVGVTLISMLGMILFAVGVTIVQFEPYSIFVVAPVAFGFLVWVVITALERWAAHD